MQRKVNCDTKTLNINLCLFRLYRVYHIIFFVFFTYCATALYILPIIRGPISYVLFYYYYAAACYIESNQFHTVVSYPLEYQLMNGTWCLCDLRDHLEINRPVYKHSMISIMAQIISISVIKYEIIYPFPYFNRWCWKMDIWLCYFISHFTKHGNTYPTES